MPSQIRLLTVIILSFLIYILIPADQSKAQSKYQTSDSGVAVMVHAGYAKIKENVAGRWVGLSISANRKVDLSVDISNVMVKNVDGYADWNFEILSFGATVFPTRQWDGNSVTSQFVLAVANSYNNYAKGIGITTGFGLSKQLDHVHPGIMLLYSPLAGGVPSENLGIGLGITFSIRLMHSLSLNLNPALNIGLNYNSWVPGVGLGIVMN
ncbi:MAG: hypothetical protein EA364_11170 [Balneolaceae bacterium]|nr:MAG: hypothetical protein EA364_11170 [Balneolaceae bacterium]